MVPILILFVANIVWSRLTWTPFYLLLHSCRRNAKRTRYFCDKEDWQRECQCCRHFATAWKWLAGYRSAWKRGACQWLTSSRGGSEERLRQSGNETIAVVTCFNSSAIVRVCVCECVCARARVRSKHCAISSCGINSYLRKKEKASII
jgi:hypothetical protein